MGTVVNISESTKLGKMIEIKILMQVRWVLSKTEVNIIRSTKFRKNMNRNLRLVWWVLFNTSKHQPVDQI